MPSAGTLLGIDFGTSNTVAFLRREDGTALPLLFDASPLLASGVFAGADGHLLTGADAGRAAAGQPGGYEPQPKQRIDDDRIWLGERELPVADVVAAVLRRVAEEAARVAGAPPDGVVLTYPAGWSRVRLGVLAAAARAAGLGEPGFVREPVAAAAYFAAVLGRDLGPRKALLVYDLGAGTFDVSVVRPRPDGSGIDVLAADGLVDVGGNDLDAVVVDHLRALTADQSAAWGRVDWPESVADRRARRTLWMDARAAKEQLTRHASADVHVPVVERTLHITRSEFEAAARPHLERTVALTLATLRAAGATQSTVGGVLLVGGSSRIPLAAALLHRALGIAPAVMEQPELVVAHGSLFITEDVQPSTVPTVPPGPAPALAPEPDLQPAPAPEPNPQPAPEPEPEPELEPEAEPEPTPEPEPAAQPVAAPVAEPVVVAGGRPRRRWLIGIAAVVVAALVVLVVVHPWTADHAEGNSSGSNPGAASAATKSAAPAAPTVSPGVIPKGGDSKTFGLGLHSSVTSPDGSRGYVCVPGSDTVLMVDMASRAVAGSVSLPGDSPSTLALSKSGDTGYIGTYEGNIVVVDAAAGKVQRTISVGKPVQGVAVTPDGKDAWVGTSTSLVRVALESGTVTPVAGLTNVATFGGVAVSPDGAEVYFATFAGVTVLSAADGSKLAEIHTNDGKRGAARAVTFTKDGHTALVSNSEGITTEQHGTLSIIDTARRTVTRTVTVGPLPMDVVVGADAYVLTGQPGEVTVVNLGSGAVTRTVPVKAERPMSLTLAPDGRTALVLQDTTKFTVLDVGA